MSLHINACASNRTGVGCRCFTDLIHGGSVISPSSDGNNSCYLCYQPCALFLSPDFIAYIYGMRRRVGMIIREQLPRYR